MQRLIAIKQSRWSATRFGVPLFIAIGLVLGAATIARAAFNQPGNILITDSVQQSRDRNRPRWQHRLAVRKRSG